MNASVVASLILFVILAVGFIRLATGLHRLSAKYELLKEFTNKFINLSNVYFLKGDLLREDYEWLLANVDEVNGMTGLAGTVSYRPASANYIHNNYQVLINTIPQFKTRLGVEPDDASFIESLLKRVAGVLNKTISEERRDLKNPIKWFSEGISALLSIPLSILKSLGVISGAGYSKVTGSGLFKGFVAIIALISFVDTIYTIISGSSFTIKFIQDIISRF